MGNTFGATMPWNKRTEIDQRWDFVQQTQAPNACIAKLCRAWKVSRKTAYKWLSRYRRKGLRGLKNEPTTAHSLPHQYDKKWQQRARRIRVKHKWWGARKVQHQLQLKYGKKDTPTVATLGRWLKAAKLTRGRRKRSSPGPVVGRKAPRKAVFANDVWTADFKGWFRLHDGTRVEPLTVRDLASSYALAARLMKQQNVARTIAAFRLLFRRNGLPGAILVDNGSPFGSKGPAGLTRLSAWWIKQGIAVEFIRPGHPEDNAGHEHFHGLMKREITNPPAKTWQGQQRRTQKWIKEYNEMRPHEKLAMATPAQRYQKSHRKMPADENRRLAYPVQWESRMVNCNGFISWRGQLRFIGEAFVGECVGLKKDGASQWRVYFEKLLLGVLKDEGKSGISPAQYKRRQSRK